MRYSYGLKAYLSPLFLVVIFVFVHCLSLEVQSSPKKKTKTAAPPKILYDVTSLPEPVKKMRDAILQAARTGDIEEMRPVLESNEIPPVVSFGSSEDPISFWKTTSGDGKGREILAIMLEIFESGFVRINVGKKDEAFIWPYFHELPLDKLTPAQEVELYRLVHPKDVKVMKEAGSYLHYRGGITKDGTWQYFVAGD